jgi:hypothetical protein
LFSLSPQRSPLRLTPGICSHLRGQPVRYIGSIPVHRGPVRRNVSILGVARWPQRLCRPKEFTANCDITAAMTAGVKRSPIRGDRLFFENPRSRAQDGAVLFGAPFHAYRNGPGATSDLERRVGATTPRPGIDRCSSYE